MDQEGKIKAVKVIDNQMIEKWIQMKGQILDGFRSKMQLALGRATCLAGVMEGVEMKP